jgi:hypothetical protein
MNDQQAQALAVAAQNPVYHRVAEWLRSCFPGAEIGAADVALLLELLKTAEPEFIHALEGFLKQKIPSVSLDHESIAALERVPTTTHTTYQIDGVHLRTTPIFSCFTGVVKAVRVRLHQNLKLPFFTVYGTVWAHDHIVFTIDEIRTWLRENYPDFNPSFQRVDLITPARHDLFRFAPVALFFAYETPTSPVPSFFIIESGYANGKPAVLYLGRTMTTKIVAKTGYKPTPFSNPDNTYTSTLTLQDSHGPLGLGADEPDVLVIESREQLDERPYITLTMKYTVEATPGQVIFPGKQFIEAGIRVESISLGLGEELDELQKLIAELGLKWLQWNLWPVPERTQ